MSYKVEVIADETGKWIPNGQRWASKEATDAYAVALQWRWTAVRDFRVVETEDPVTEAA